MFGGGDFVARVVGVFMIAIMARTVTPAELGLFSLIAATTGPFALAIGFGGENTFTRFYFDTSDPDRRRAIATSWAIWLGLFGGVGVLVVWLLSEPLSIFLSGTPEHAVALVLGLAAMPIVILGFTFSQILRIQGRTVPFITLNVAAALVYLALGSLLLLQFDFGVVGVLAAGLIAAAVVLPLRLWLVRGDLAFAISADALRRMIGYGSWAAVAGLGVVVLAFVDRLIVGRVLGLETLGYYGVAVTLQSALGLLVIAVGQAWLPLVLRMWQEKPAEVPAFVARAATLLLLVFASAAAALIVFADQIVLVLAGPRYLEARVAVPGLALATVAHALTIITSLGLHVSKSTAKLAIMSAIAAIAGVALFLLLTPRFGMLGASWGIATAYAILASLYNIASQQVWPIKYERRRVTGLIALLLAFSILAPRVKTGSLALDLITAAGLLLIFVIAGCTIANVRPNQITANFPWRQQRSSKKTE